MDRIFEASETSAYEAWLDTPAGRTYLSASLNLLDHILDCQPGWRVLDVGCGLGVHLENFVERGMLAHGLDAGPVMTKLAGRRLGRKAEITLGDAHDLPYEDNQFDAVVLINTLELTGRRAQVLAEASRVAASRLCVITFNPFDPIARIRRWMGREHPLQLGRPISLLGLRHLIREVLGPVPMSWSAAQAWPMQTIGRWPWGSLVGLCAAVTPRFRTRPLVIQTGPHKIKPEPVPGTGRMSHIKRIK